MDCLSKLLLCASVRCGKAYLWLLPGLGIPRHSWKINAECWDLNRIFPTWTASRTCCFEVNASGSLTSEWKVWNLQLLVFYKSCVCTPDTTWHIFTSQLCKLIAVCPKIDHGLPPPKVHGVVIHGFAPIAEVISFTLPFPLSHGGLDRTPMSSACPNCTKSWGEQGKNFWSWNHTCILYTSLGPIETAETAAHTKDDFSKQKRFMCSAEFLTCQQPRSRRTCEKSDAQKAMSWCHDVMSWELHPVIGPPVRLVTTGATQ